MSRSIGTGIVKLFCTLTLLCTVAGYASYKAKAQSASERIQLAQNTFGRSNRGGQQIFRPRIFQQPRVRQRQQFGLPNLQHFGGSCRKRCGRLDGHRRAACMRRCGGGGGSNDNNGGNVAGQGNRCERRCYRLPKSRRNVCLRRCHGGGGDVVDTGNRCERRCLRRHGAARDRCFDRCNGVNEDNNRNDVVDTGGDRCERRCARLPRSRRPACERRCYGGPNDNGGGDKCWRRRRQSRRCDHGDTRAADRAAVPRYSNIAAVPRAIGSADPV